MVYFVAKILKIKRGKQLQSLSKYRDRTYQAETSEANLYYLIDWAFMFLLNS